MPATVGVNARYRYNARTMRYRDASTGRFVKPATVKRAVSAVVRKARERMRDLAGQLADRKITLRNWQESFAAELKLLHVSSAMVGAGGLANMTPADYGRVGARLRFEYDRLAGFAKALKRREFTRKQLMARVEMYCNAGHVSHEAARADAAIGAGMEQERNRLGARENHCRTAEGTREGCANLTARGWVSLGSLPPPGQRRCLSNCGCRLDFRKRPKRAALAGIG